MQRIDIKLNSRLLQIHFLVQPLQSGKKLLKPEALSEIFIPKQMAYHVAYIAWVQGVPDEEQLVAWVMGYI